MDQDPVWRLSYMQRRSPVVMRRALRHPRRCRAVNPARLAEATDDGLGGSTCVTLSPAVISTTTKRNNIVCGRRRTSVQALCEHLRPERQGRRVVFPAVDPPGDVHTGRNHDPGTVSLDVQPRPEGICLALGVDTRVSEPGCTAQRLILSGSAF